MATMKRQWTLERPDQKEKMENYSWYMQVKREHSSLYRNKIKELTELTEQQAVTPASLTLLMCGARLVFSLTISSSHRLLAAQFPRRASGAASRKQI